jgi:hypothetical protein
LRQILPRAFFTEVKLVMLAPFQLGDVKGGWFVALLAFHATPRRRKSSQS